MTKPAARRQSSLEFLWCLSGAPSEGQFAWAGARALASMSASVGKMNSASASDPVVLIGAPLLLATLARVACYLPARRSTRIDPVVALRQEERGS